MFVIGIIFTIVITTQTNYLSPNSLHLSKEKRFDFETQLREITTEEVIKFTVYDAVKINKLDVQIGTSMYLVEYDTIKGKPTVKTIKYGKEVHYDRDGIDWRK